MVLASSGTNFNASFNSTPFGMQTNRWYVGIFNSAATNVPFLAQACYATNNSPVILPLTNGIPYVAAVTNLAPPGPPRFLFFQFDITNFVDAVLFELYGMSGDADLVLQRDVVPGMAPYYDGSFRLGLTPEQIVIRRSFEVPDLRGNWYLGVYNNETNNLSYTIRAVTPDTNGVLVSAQPLAFTYSSLAPRSGVLVQWHAVVGETYLVQYSPDNTNWTTEATVVATTPFPTFVGQHSGSFYRVIQVGNVPALQPRLTIKLWTNNLVRISWPKTFLGFTLQFTPNLTAKWTDLAPPLPIVVEGNEFVVYDSRSSAARFYRLIK
jgi:hypothetical protein